VLFSSALYYVPPPFLHEFSVIIYHFHFKPLKTVHPLSLIQFNFHTLKLTLLHNCPERPRGPASLLYNVNRGYFLGLKRPVRGVD